MKSIRTNTRGIQPEHTDDMMIAFIDAKRDQWRAADRVAIACWRLQPHFTGTTAERNLSGGCCTVHWHEKGDGVTGSTINQSRTDLLRRL